MFGQSWVVIGAGIYFWHFALLKRRNRRMQSPDELVTSGGLFSMVRHPMYLADMIYYAGLAMMWPGTISIGLVMVSWVALINQARIEDAWCGQRFTVQHSQWSQNTRMILPYIY